MSAVRRLALVLALAATACRTRHASPPASPPAPTHPVPAPTQDVPAVPSFALPSPVAYAHYHNDRFDYDVDYPAFLAPQPESDMGDGRRFVAGHHVEMWVSGYFNAAGSTREDLLREAEAEARRDGRRIAMRRNVRRGFVLSTVAPGRITYEYRVVNDRVFAAVGFEYDDALRAAMDPVVSRVVRSFVPPAEDAGADDEATSDDDAPSVVTDAAMVRPCALANLRAELGDEDAAAGHRATPLILRNAGAVACRLSGYPDVAALDARGAVVMRGRRTLSGAMGGLADGASVPAVDLAPGAAASVLLETLGARTDGRACTAFAALRVTPPGASGSLRVPWRGTGCWALEVHPVVPGESGQPP